MASMDVSHLGTNVKLKCAGQFCLSLHTNLQVLRPSLCKAAVLLNNGTADAQGVCEGGGGEHSTD